MKSSAGEDILEAAYTLWVANGRMPTVREVAARVAKEEGTVREEARDLAAEGYVSLRGGEILELSDKGKETGARVEKKHRVLECFLSEVLGMERSAASEEACILEHGISDETLDRLEGFISRPGPGGYRFRRGRRRLQSLADFREGSELRVIAIRPICGCERLGDLGILPGETLRVVHVLNHKAVVVRVKGCDIALSPEIASSILVEKVP
ncbi:MAG: metal-dependent transcriptional regulator [Methanolinea sp.]